MTDAQSVPESWGKAWRSRGGSLAVAQLRVRAARETRRMLWSTTVQLLLTVAALMLVGRVLMEHLGALHAAWGAGIVLLLVATWWLTLVNRRGVWRPYTETTKAFLDLARERCKRRLAMARVLLWIACANLALTAGVVWWQVAAAGAPTHWADRTTAALAVVLVATAATWAARTRRSVERESVHLDALAADT